MDIIKFGIEHFLYPYMEKKRGNCVRKYTKELQASQYLSRNDLQKIQEEKLRELLLFCAENVPEYSYLDKTEIEKDPLCVLHNKVKLLDKPYFRDNQEKFFAVSLPKSQRIKNMTGGSTGEPLNFYMDRFQVEHYEAARWRGLSWYGISYGSRSVMLWANPVDLSNAKLKKYQNKEKYLKNRVVISAFDMSDDKAEEYVSLLNKYKPEYLYGYSSALYLFAKIIKKYGIQNLHIKLKLICYTSEAISPENKFFIAEVFGCPVAGEYGARDGGILAYGCPEGNTHITAENAIIEVLDPVTHLPVMDGQPGVLAITDLNMRVQPRLRYLIGDVGTISKDNTCQCGINLPLMEGISGREDDILVRMDGSLAYGVVITTYARNYSQIRQVRFIQHSRETATLYLAMDNAPEVANKLKNEISEALGGIQIELKLVDEIKPSASGKMRYAIREFPLAEV